MGLATRLSNMLFRNVNLVVVHVAVAPVFPAVVLFLACLVILRLVVILLVNEPGTFLTWDRFMPMNKKGRS